MTLLSLSLKRSVDFVTASLLLVVTAPIFFIVLLLIYLSDFSSPFYVSNRVGKGGRLFKIIKFRTMYVGADKSKVDTTVKNDTRITKVGCFLRRNKLDEIPQLINILKGDMSFIGPRPNVEREVALYSSQEMRLLSIRPGLTDYSSIIFSDLAEIIANHADANIAYNQLVRPWKSRLGLLYVQTHSFGSDLKIFFYTALAIFFAKKARKMIIRQLISLNVDQEMLDIVSRKKALYPCPPPGLDNVIVSRVCKTLTN
ncbi:MAG: sugar transferase [Coxiellaceae bacterium]|nr:sugar transferase [Coxiellaceae bacterium]MDF1865543.1 sugar transferase [Saprospiraceae bacterium]